MKSHFSLAPDLNIEIEPDKVNDQIVFRTVEGVNDEIPYIPFVSPPGGRGGGSREYRYINLSKVQARAMASALMGVAAEL